jgi:hypothetical protein
MLLSCWGYIQKTRDYVTSFFALPIHTGMLHLYCRRCTFTVYFCGAGHKNTDNVQQLLIVVIDDFGKMSHLL